MFNMSNNMSNMKFRANTFKLLDMTNMQNMQNNMHNMHNMQYDFNMSNMLSPLCWCVLPSWIQVLPPAPIWKLEAASDHLAHISICGHILRYTLYIMSYTMLPYNSVWNSRKSYISVYTTSYISEARHIRLAKSISPYTSRYTIIRVTQYMSVYLSMKFSDKVYTCMYWVHASGPGCLYFYS